MPIRLAHPARLTSSLVSLVSLVLFVGVLMLATGCGDDDDPVRPAATPTGSIALTTDPPDLEAPWLLSGPDGFSMAGSGATVLAEAVVGQYTLTWGQLAGWLAPEPPVQSATLAESQQVAFTGVYTPDEPELPEPPPGFRTIPAGSFVMGSPPDEPGRVAAREAQRTVTLTRSFFMAEVPVTEQLYAEVMGGVADSQLPRVLVSWDQAIAFCNALSLRDGLPPAYTIDGPGQVIWNPSAGGYRLPTEAEWEYACRAQTTAAFNNGTDCLSADTEANYDGGSPLAGCPTGQARGERTPVGSFPPNAWGLFDMHGNVRDWCWDIHQDDHTVFGEVDPVGGGLVHDSTANRAVRGGHFNFNAAVCRSAHRSGLAPGVLFSNTGFRVVRNVP